MIDNESMSGRFFFYILHSALNDFLIESLYRPSVSDYLHFTARLEGKKKSLMTNNMCPMNEKNIMFQKERLNTRYKANWDPKRKSMKSSRSRYEMIIDYERIFGQE